MSKKKREELSEAILEIADRIDALDQGLSEAEMDEVLREGGCNPTDSWARFLSAARVLESESWAKGIEPSLQLRRLVSESTQATGEVLAPLVAARAWIDQLTAGAWQKLPPADQAQAVWAYRKSGDLSLADIEKLDALEAELRDHGNEPADE